MKPTHTGIATALALAVVLLIFGIIPGLPIFGGASQQAAVSATDTAQDQAFTPTTTTSPTTMPTEITQLMMKDDTVGTGAAAATGDTVTVQYVGALTDGKVFDASANHGKDGFTFTLGAGQVIKGWDQGLVGMKEGGKRTLLIPAALAYGDQEVGGVIPANSALIFQVELVKVQKAAQ